MVSLLELAEVTEEGVRFLSPHDGTPMYALPPHPFPNIPLTNSKAPHTRTFHLPPKYHRLRYHHAA